jgi:nitrogen fixation protein FixH
MSDYAEEQVPLTGRTVLIWLLAFFGVVIGVNMIMMRLATQTLPGTDTDSAYRSSLAYQSEINAARAQAELGWKVTADIVRSETGQVRINLAGLDRAGAPLNDIDFSATLNRPINSRMDHSVMLVRDGRGAYHADIADVARGQWDLQIEGERGGRRLYRSVNRVIFE